MTKTPSPHVIEIDDESFEQEVLASPLPFLLQATAAHCGPCRQLAPIVARVAASSAGRLRVGVLDIERAPRVAALLSIRAAPTLVVFRAGEEQARRVGLTDERSVRDLALS